MKFKHIFASLALSLTLGTGLLMGVSHPVMSKAAGEEVDNVVYLELDPNIWGVADAYYFIYYWRGENPCVDGTFPGASFNDNKPASGSAVISAEWDPTSTNCIISRYQDAEHTVEWNRWNWFSPNDHAGDGQEHSFVAGTYNYFKNTAYDSCDSSKVITIKEHFNDSFYNVPVAPNSAVPEKPCGHVPGQHFEGWYMDATFETPMEEGLKVTKLTHLYAKFAENTQQK